MTAAAAKISATARLEVVEKVGNAANGNPRYRCVLRLATGGVLLGLTRSDAQFAYTMPPAGADVIVTFHYARGGVVIDDLFRSQP